MASRRGPSPPPPEHAPLPVRNPLPAPTPPPRPPDGRIPSVRPPPPPNLPHLATPPPPAPLAAAAVDDPTRVFRPPQPAFVAAPTPASPFRPPATPDELEKALARASYLCDPPTCLALWLALKLERPLLIEGPAGVGKTDLARAAASALGRPLIRLTCYEGVDEAKALYEWDYGKQMLYTQLMRDVIAREVEGATTIADAADLIAKSESTFYSERFLVPRPVLSALQSAIPAVLLIDEIDRADPQLEAMLLEMLADYQVTIPEIGTIAAKHKPLVLLTNNRVRDMTDALRRRCLHAFIDHPSASRELAIVKLKAPDIEDELARQLVRFVQQLRSMDLRKVPSISETIEWARALLALGIRVLDPAMAAQTLGLLLKHAEDRTKVERQTGELVAVAQRTR